MATRRKVNNLLALGILAMLNSGRPMHPYELANVLRGKHVPHELVLLEGIGHMFNFDFCQETPMPPQLKPAVLAFLAKYLAPIPSPAN